MKTVRLIDGTEVRSDSEEWKIECLARYLIALTDEKREEHFAAFEKRSGIAATDRIRAVVKQVRQRGGEQAELAQTDRASAKSPTLARHPQGMSALLVRESPNQRLMRYRP
jgi:hypothetical protein